MLLRKAPRLSAQAGPGRDYSVVKKAIQPPIGQPWAAAFQGKPLLSATGSRLRGNPAGLYAARSICWVAPFLCRGMLQGPGFLAKLEIKGLSAPLHFPQKVTAGGNLEKRSRTGEIKDFEPLGFSLFPCLPTFCGFPRYARGRSRAEGQGPPLRVLSKKGS